MGFEPMPTESQFGMLTATPVDTFKLVLGAGIEPALGPHLGHHGYKPCGASSYTNPVFKIL